MTLVKENKPNARPTSAVTPTGKGPNSPSNTQPKSAPAATASPAKAGRARTNNRNVRAPKRGSTGRQAAEPTVQAVREHRDIRQSAITTFVLAVALAIGAVWVRWHDPVAVGSIVGTVLLTLAATWRLMR